jgi:hypothetical protein
MRDFHKNPILYYLLIPVLVGLWPLLVRAVYLPKAEREREAEAGQCVEGQNYVIDILTIDPDRPIAVGTATVPVEFSYNAAVDRVANLCKIPASNCSYQAGDFMVSGGKKRQDARVKLTNVGVVQIARFLSTMQSMWVNLTCENVKIQKKKGTPDQWDVDFSFLYYY